MHFLSFLKNSYDFIKHIFLKGFIFLLPIAITISLFNFCFNLILSWLGPVKNLPIPFLKNIPHYEIIVLMLSILCVGAFLKIFVVKPFIKLLEDIFSQIPLLSTVYFGTKQLIFAFSGQNKTSFKDVVYVQFPRPGIYSIGFLTSKAPAEIAPDTTKTYYNIYIPTTPNPTTGFFVVLPQEEFHHANLTRQEAITLIISGGILQPDRYKKETEAPIDF